MDTKHLVLGGLAGAAILVGGLLLAPEGDDPGRADAAPPATERLATDGAATPAPVEPSPGGASDADGQDRNTPVSSDGAVGEAPAGGPSSRAEPGSTGSRTAAEPAGTGGSGSTSGSSAAGGSGSSDGTAGTSAAAQDPSTASILRSTARAYDRVESMRADFQQVLRNTLLGSTARSSGTLYQRSPDRFLMKFSDPAGDIIVSDGRSFWLYFPSTDPRQVLRTPRGSQGLDLQSQFIGDPVDRFRATYHGRETDRGRTTHVLTLVPREPLGYEKLKVWIDAEDHLVRKFELTEGNGVVRHFVLSNLTLNPDLPDSLFEFTPPEGATVIDRG